MMGVGESELRVGNPVRGGHDVGAHAGRVGLKGKDVEVAHHLHVLAAFVALGDFDLDRRGVGRVTLAVGDPGLFHGGLLLTGFDPGDAALDGADAVEILVEFVLIFLRQTPAEVLCAADDKIEQLPIDRLGRGVLPD